MKPRAFLILFLVLTLAQSAFCQDVDWRLKIPAAPYKVDVTRAWLAGVDGLGGAVFVLNDSRFYPPEVNIGGMETAGTRIIWVSRTGTILYTLTLEGETRNGPGIFSVTPLAVQIYLMDDAAKITKIKRVIRTVRGVKATDYDTVPGDTIASPNRLPDMTDPFGYFAFKASGEHVTQIVRYKY